MLSGNFGNSHVTRFCFIYDLDSIRWWGYERVG